LLYFVYEVWQDAGLCETRSQSLGLGWVAWTSGLWRSRWRRATLDTVDAVVLFVQVQIRRCVQRNLGRLMLHHANIQEHLQRSTLSRRRKPPFGMLSHSRLQKAVHDSSSGRWSCRRTHTTGSISRIRHRRPFSSDECHAEAIRCLERC